MSNKITLNGAELFPTRYFSGADLADKSYIVEIRDIAQQEMTNPRTKQQVVKPVIFFVKPVRGAVLGKEFAESIATSLNERDANKWIGQKIVIYPKQTRLGTGIRARAVGTNNAEPAPDATGEEDAEE
jgi:hypothetical protein